MFRKPPSFSSLPPIPTITKWTRRDNQLPYLEEIHQSYAPDKGTDLGLKILNGEIDLKAQTLDVASLPLYQQNTEKGHFEIQMAQGASNGNIYAFNCTHKDPELAKLFSNPEFSRAMSLA